MDWQPTYLFGNFLTITILGKTIDYILGFIEGLTNVFYFVIILVNSIESVSGDLKFKDMVNDKASALTLVVWFADFIVALVSCLGDYELVVFEVHFVPIDLLLILVQLSRILACTAISWLLDPGVETKCNPIADS